MSPQPFERRPNAGAEHVRTDVDSLKRLWALAGPLRGRILRGIVFRLAQLMSLGLAFGVVVWIVVEFAGGRPPDWVWIWQVVGLMALSFMGQLLFGYLSAADCWFASFDLVGELRLSVLDRLRHLPMGFHLSRHKGDTVTALTSDMQMLESFLSDALPRIVQALGLPVVVLLFLLWRDWAIALATLASIVLAAPVFFCGRAGGLRRSLSSGRTGRPRPARG